MADPVTATIAVLALAVSATTAWLTLFRRGTIRMTQPTVIFFGPDSPRSAKERPLPKIYLRTLLFTNSKRGRVIESMHVSLKRNETRQNFNVWVHGDDKLVRGSGLFVGETGIAANHHFLAPDDGNSFNFCAGSYTLDVYAKLLGDKKQTLLFSQRLEVSQDLAHAIQEAGTGLYFDWGPDSSRYIPHVEKRLPAPDPEAFLEKLDIALRSNKAPVDGGKQFPPLPTPPAT